MTSLCAPLPCEICGGFLLPGHVFHAHHAFPSDVEYVCDDCGRLYTWEGSPPRLTMVPNLVIFRPRINPDSIL